MKQLWLYGYRCARVSASGQRKGSRRDQEGIDGDIIAFANRDRTLPHLIVEVGGRSKNVSESFREITEHGLPPGFRPMVARCMPNRRWRYHHDPDVDGVDSLDEFFSLLRTA